LIKRRDFLIGSAVAATSVAAGLSIPSIARASERTLTFIPESNLANPDPVWSFSTVVRNFSHMVWDNLFGLDSALNVRPQMIQDYEVSNDGLLWRMRLREGLKFHDGEPVRAADCVASVSRWMKRDVFGQQIELSLNELRAVDERTFEFDLKRPFPLLPNALAKTATMVCFIMPERIAKTDPFEQITEYVGSGPFRFLNDEWQPGIRASFAKFDGYVPRNEASDLTSGGKNVLVDRVEWHTIPDASTAAAALQAGEIDWWQNPTADMLPLLRGSDGVVVQTLDDFGVIPVMRNNFLTNPGSNEKFRRALLPALNQADFLAAAVGDPALTRAGVGVFTPGSALANDAGLEVLTGPRDLEKAKQLLAESGYAGEKIVFLAPTDYPGINAVSQVGADLMRRIGINVELVETDFATMLQRRNNRGPVEDGGWTVFCTTVEGVNMVDPASHTAIVGNGEKGWAGWHESPRLAGLRNDWFAAPDLAAQQAIARDIQTTTWEEVPYYPLGQWFQPTSHRNTVSDIPRAPFPLFWNVKKA